MRRSLPLGPSLQAAAGFVPTALVRAPGALLLLALAVAAAAYDPNFGLGPGALGLPGAAAALLAGLVAQGALYRLGVSGDVRSARTRGLGPLGLQFGRVELRLLAAAVMVGVFLALVLIALGLLLAFAARALGVAFDPTEILEAADGWRLQALAVVGLVAAWVFLQLSVRLALYKAATVGRARVVSLDALGLSEHNFWRLLSGAVVTLAPTLALVAWRGSGGDAGVWTGALCAAVAAFVQAPLTIGFFSEAYRRLEYWS